jgi:propionate CoA-transferase
VSKVVALDDALATIRAGDAVASVGVIGWLVPDTLLKGIAQRFEEGRGPGGLTFFFPVGVGDALDIRGMDHVAISGLMRRVVSGSYVNPVHPVTGRRPETPAQLMRVPGALVDFVVVEPDAMMTTDVSHDGRYLGGKFSRDGLNPLPRGVEKVIAQRAAKEVRKGEVSIFGFGLATGIPLIMAEDGLFDDGGIDDFPHTTEHGAFGGVVMNGWQFSANLFPEALIDGPSQFDFIDGGNCTFAALSFAQLDVAGNINVSKFSGFSPGSGGFIDIATSATRLVFTGTMTTGGLDCRLAEGGLSIAREGWIRKFVAAADQITYPLRAGIAERKQSALIVTERAVFQMDAQGLVLTEIADGVDLDRDVLGQMECGTVRVASGLVRMEPSLFAN